MWAAKFAYFLTVFVLAVIFSFWSRKAILKYIEQPVSSSIQFRFGDDDNGNIWFLKLSVCPWDFAAFISHLPADHCGMNSTYFFGFMTDCLRANASMEQILKDLSINWTQVLPMYKMVPSIFDENFGDVHRNELWEDYIDWVYGFCTMFHLTNFQEFNMLSVTSQFRNPSFELRANLASSRLTEGLVIQLHNGTDVYDSSELYPAFGLTRGEIRLVKFDKKVISTLPSKSSACAEKPKWTCVVKHITIALIEKYKCRLPFGSSLIVDKSITAKYPYCNSSLALDLAEHDLNPGAASNMKISSCPFRQPCNLVKYSLQADGGIGENSNEAYLSLSLLSASIEYIVDSYNYDTQSFVGEVGGTLGLLLGLSFMSFLDAMMWLARKMYQK